MSQIRKEMSILYLRSYNDILLTLTVGDLLWGHSKDSVREFAHRPSLPSTEMAGGGGSRDFAVAAAGRMRVLSARALERSGSLGIPRNSA